MKKYGGFYKKFKVAQIIQSDKDSKNEIINEDVETDSVSDEDVETDLSQGAYIMDLESQLDSVEEELQDALNTIRKHDLRIQELELELIDLKEREKLKKK